MQNDSVKFKKKYRSKGYTLMEMVVAVGIFVIVMTAITGVFIAIMRVQRKTQAMQAVQQDARWAMETIARHARMEKIKYCEDRTKINCHIIFPGAGQIGFDDVGTLYLENNTFEFEKEETKLTMNGNAITPAKIEVLDLKFYIAPESEKDPENLEHYFSPYNSSGPNEQSRVTILMKTRSAEAKPAEEAEITLQTTVSTRAYTR